MDVFNFFLMLGVSEKLAEQISLFCQKNNLTVEEWFYLANNLCYSYCSNSEAMEYNLAFAKSVVEHPEYWVDIKDDYIFT